MALLSNDGIFTFIEMNGRKYRIIKEPYDYLETLQSKLAEAEEKLKLYQDYVEKMAGAFWASKYQDAEAAAQDILIALAKIESTK